MARPFSRLLIPMVALGALAAAATLVSCAGKDNRFGILVREVREGTAGFQSRHSLSVRGDFHAQPQCWSADADGDTEVEVVGFTNGWAQVTGLATNTLYSLRCETSREIVTIAGRTLKDTETMVSDKGFSSSGEIISGAIDCYFESRVIDYHRGTGRLFAFSGGRFPCITQFDGDRWRSTRLDANYRSTLQPVPSADQVTFENGNAILFDDDVDVDTLNSRGVLRVWKCNGVCDSRALWTSSTIETMPSSGLAAARSADGTKVAVAAVTSTGSPRLRVAMCSSGADCGDTSLWTVFNFSTLGLDSTTKRVEVRFDAVGNLWVLAPSTASPGLACRASAFPCATLVAWRMGGFNPTGTLVNTVRQQRPAFASDVRGTRFIGPAGGGSLPAKAVIAAECGAMSDCTALVGNRFTQFSTVIRTAAALFPTELSFFHLGVSFTDVHYQESNAPNAVRFKRCDNSFSQCSDPASGLWSAAAPVADGEDYGDYARNQLRVASDSEGDAIGMFADDDLDIVSLVYLRP